MIQYTCDLCGCLINSDSSRRFVVKLEIYPIDTSLEIVPMDSDTDPIELMEKMIESANEIEIQELPRNETRRFDLCCDCHKKFSADPLGRKTSRKVYFSSN
jgi:hypothetical protein